MEASIEPLCKVAKTDVHPFHGFKEAHVLNELKDKKSVFLHAVVEPGNQDAVVILEKKPFDTSEEGLASLLSSETKLEQVISNDIYSTYSATPKPRHGMLKVKNHSRAKLETVVVFGNKLAVTEGFLHSNNETTLIYPATQKHIDKYRKQEVVVVEETYDDYKNVTLPYLEEENKFSVQWVFNILDKQTESERIVFEDDDAETGFILLPDMKWDVSDLNSLYLIALIHKRGIKSLRDLTAEHLPLLRGILSKGQKAIFDKYNIPKEKLRIYVHYQPSYYHLHVHFTHIDFDAPGTTVTRAHLLCDIIQNIEIAADYYQTKTLTFVGRKEDKLTIALQKSH